MSVSKAIGQFRRFKRRMMQGISTSGQIACEYIQYAFTSAAGPYMH